MITSHAVDTVAYTIHTRNDIRYMAHTIHTVCAGRENCLNLRGKSQGNYRKPSDNYKKLWCFLFLFLHYCQLLINYWLELVN